MWLTVINQIMRNNCKYIYIYNYTCIHMATFIMCSITYMHVWVWCYNFPPTRWVWLMHKGLPVNIKKGETMNRKWTANACMVSMYVVLAIIKYMKVKGHLLDYYLAGSTKRQMLSVNLLQKRRKPRKFVSLRRTCPVGYMWLYIACVICQMLPTSSRWTWTLSNITWLGACSSIRTST